MSEKPTIEEVKAALKEKFGERIISESQEYDFPLFIIRKDAVVEVIRFLYDDANFQFRYLTTMCGLHHPESPQPFGLMYQLHSLVNNLRIRFKAFTTKDDLEYETLTGIFSAANWMEREAYDFYGFRFKGHPNLKRILNVEDMDYFPMRKEYKLEDETRTDKDDTLFGRLGNSVVKV
ncbi:MAG: NADH-quinone oxidoreductase subunit C [Bacteroidota bacterium]